MKLKTKFGLLISILVIGIVLGVTGFLFVTESEFLSNEMGKTRSNLMKGFVQVAEQGVSERDNIIIVNYLKLLQNTNGFNYAAITDTYNKVIFHSDKYLEGSVLQDAYSQNACKANMLLVQRYRTAAGLAILDLAMPIEIRNVKVAVARLGFSQTVIADEIKEALRTTRRRIVFVAIASLAVGMFSTLVLINMMAEPIQKIAEGAKLIGQGKLDQKIIVSSKDELGDLAREFNKMSDKLKELDQLKSDFVSSVTHELRSPLLSLRLYLDLFLKGTAGAITDQQKEYLTIMRNCTLRLSRFIDDLLDIAKIERGKMEVSVKPMDVIPIIRETAQLFQPQVDQKHIGLKTDIPEKLPQVMGDAERVRQVITNLLSNAVKFTPENGVITLKSHIVEAAKMMEISIHDTGIGIPEDKLYSVFNKFEQIKETRKNVSGPKGTGLGLAIIKGLVEAQNGKIWVTSELGKGSIFTFSVPLVKEN